MRKEAKNSCVNISPGSCFMLRSGRATLPNFTPNWAIFGIKHLTHKSCTVNIPERNNRLLTSAHLRLISNCASTFQSTFELHQSPLCQSKTITMIDFRKACESVLEVAFSHASITDTCVQAEHLSVFPSSVQYVSTFLDHIA